MRAARLTAWREPLEIVDLPYPEAPKGGVVVRIGMPGSGPIRMCQYPIPPAMSFAAR